MASAGAEDPIIASLSIMRRMPPNKIEQNLSGLLNLIPDQTDELLQRVDQPLQEATCGQTGRPFLLCDYNRDGDSYRSPWSNQYDPPIDDGFTPSEALRQMEIDANSLYDSYRDQYYEGGTSSVYLWDLDDGFAGCFLIKKSVEGHAFVSAGSWDSIHVVEVTEKGGGQATYKLTSTLLLSMGVNKAAVGDSNLSGCMTKQKEMTCEVTAVRPHTTNMGTMIEDMEIELRSNMDSLYISKTREIVSSMRNMRLRAPVQGANFTNSLNQAVLGHGAKKLPMP
uniref:F-actin-capping protein subunit beta n=1 Tax=Octactis speculum TaxID=3111310 RepID=A0A7S2F5N5_9STRA|mmetsp:Transcript_13256/g.17484  ORF Transcript_13256/g.17484 Transcript_13256/m.17484 type:complete len:281 (+) Transcript_13256:28-870(+)|eukprot:CAMPEP_0185759980 /NCGR_PEP_ID=MMETSP1174-20130828/18794_1 /TAXON_ID=35687 /ORGANISM="Dictyocha speculum, Strain CCMP1381" /LENGTH=280 /DNA_ID=CAMNT_0028440585 /DNA_START=30 /DNA_END=872 /DNA_ORIENTATION=+